MTKKINPPLQRDDINEVFVNEIIKGNTERIINFLLNFLVRAFKKERKKVTTALINKTT